MARHPLATWPMGIAGKYPFGKAVTNLATATFGTRTHAPRAADSLALRPLLFPLRVAPLQQILGAGPAQMRAAVLHHHLAIDVAGRIGNQETCKICKLAVFADATERISGGPAFVAAFWPKLARRARGRKRSGRNRDRADALGAPLHRETPGHRKN